jgi:hypothetical protein
MANSNAKTNKPVKIMRLRGISASIFANPAKSRTNEDSTFYKVSIQRTYKDGDEFKTTSSFSRDDLPIVWLLSQKAWEFVLKEEATKN